MKTLDGDPILDEFLYNSNSKSSNNDIDKTGEINSDSLLDDFFYNSGSNLNNDNDTNENNDFYLNELYSKYYENTLTKEYLHNVLYDLTYHDIANFIISLIKDINLLDKHINKEHLTDTEKDKYELKISSLRNVINNKNDNIKNLYEEIDNLKTKIDNLIQDRRVIFKAASKLNQKQNLLVYIDKVLQEEKAEDEFKILFDTYSKELCENKEKYKKIVNK